jgi:hypothetical protein
MRIAKQLKCTTAEVNDWRVHGVSISASSLRTMVRRTRRREAARGQEQVQPLPETPHAQRHRSVIESTI